MIQNDDDKININRGTIRDIINNLKNWKAIGYSEMKGMANQNMVKTHHRKIKSIWSKKIIFVKLTMRIAHQKLESK